MKICLVEYTLSYPNHGALSSYHDVLESYYWGFNALGFQVERRGNQIIGDAINIIFGYQIPMQLGLIDSYPENTIFINFERLAGGYSLEMEKVVGQRFQVWDYSDANMSIWKSIPTKFPVFFAKIAYAPILEKVPSNVIQDIDFLFYGSLTPERREVISKITKMRNDLSHLSVVTLISIYGKQRDEFIARSKVVLNISHQVNFEIVRVSYLLANKKPVLCYTDNQMLQVEEDLKDNCLKFVDANNVYDECELLISDQIYRDTYAEKCYQIFKKRDVMQVIKDFFKL